MVNKEFPSRAKVYDEKFAASLPLDWEMRVLGKYVVVNGSLLDVGCGTGRHTTILSKQGYNVTGIDLDRDFLVAAKIKLKREKQGANLLVADALKLPFRKNSFDYVICMGNVLGEIGVHAKHREVMIKEMREVSKGKGTLLIELVHRYWKPKDVLSWLWRYLTTTFKKLAGQPIEYGDYTEKIRIDDHEEKLTFHAFATKEAKRLLQTWGLQTKIEKRGRRLFDWFFVIAVKS